MEVALLAGFMALLGAVVGAVVQYGLGRRASKADREVAAAADVKTRLREWRIRQLDETAAMLTEHLDRFLDMIADPTSKKPATPSRPDANLSLVGDRDAVVAYVRAVAAMSKFVPKTLGEAARLAITPREMPVDLLVQVTSARTAVLTALDRQRERVLRDEDVVLFRDPDDFPEDLRELAARIPTG